jgi:hypothetical protein
LADKLRQVHTIAQLMQYLHEELGWPVDVDDWEVNLFDWQPEEINLKAEHVVKVKSIKQLRPLVSGQPWGIFFVEFNKGRLPITALRRVLNGLVPKGRAASGGHQTWAAHDLLFVSSFGESDAREIALAHFTDESAQGDLPTLRVLGWDDDDTPMQMGYVAQTLRDKLRWPANHLTADDLAKWRAQWSSAFSLGYGQVINDAKTLALAMAELAKRIRRRVNTVLVLESTSGHLRQMHKAFKDNLIADLSEDALADMFAQTITYGLFTARASRSSGALVADNLADMVPSTNPFLKELLGSFLSAAGRSRNRQKRVDFDELGINEVVSVLREVPMDAVLRSFNASKPGDDPVIHFYEDFLKAYDKAMRAKRGVFYTPSPVVQFIVRSVDEILRTEFGLEDGLASTITWGEYLARQKSTVPPEPVEGSMPRPPLTLPKFCTEATPFVQVLDPATGTGTFIVEVITQIHAYMLKKWAKQGKVTKAQWQPLWVDYVKRHLLPRLYAFELMMAPYAIAHMKIGLKLAETGYTFPEDGPRVNVFLTNALEPAHPVQAHLESMAPMLAHEANAANLAKEQCCFTVIVGNPPYAGHSANNNVPGIVAAVHEYKRGYPDLQKPGQGKWLQNDYVKFIRLSELRISASGVGVLGFITDNSYLDNPTFKGMRHHLRKSFSYIRIVDLHGNSKKKETSLDGTKDESVFGIMQGTAIGLFVHGASSASDKCLDILGLETVKAEAMLRISLQKEILSPFAPNEPFWLFKSQTQVGRNDYESGWPLPLIFSPNGDPAPGIVTTQDDFAISWTDKDAIAKVQALLASNTEREARELFQLCTQDQWNYENAKLALGDGSWKKKIVPVLYRPFDTRVTVYDKHVAVHRRERVTSHFLAGKNLGMSCTRAIEIQGNFQHVFCTAYLTQLHTVSLKEINYLFPVWRYVSASREPNLASHFVDALESVLNLTPTDYRPEDSTAPLHAEKIFHYLYAVLHSPAYRQRYAAFLRTDFPRIPIPGSRKVFDALAKLGAELVAWHLLEHPDAIKMVAGEAGSAGSPAWFGNDFSLVKVGEKGKELAQVRASTGSAGTEVDSGRTGATGKVDAVGKLFVNATSGFANVHQSIWQHTIGGYQVLHKWLHDRHKAGRALSQDDITHWLCVYAALQATKKLMLQVDEAIEANGGWPGDGKDSAQCAFSQNHPPPDAATLAAEQMAQKDQLKAQKKAASASKKRAASVSPTGATSLFDFDDDLDGLAAASGAPPRPKARATPAAKAAGGKGSRRAGSADGFNEGQVMCAIRRVLAGAGNSGLSRDVLIRSTARELGQARTSPALKVELDAAIRRAVRRGIAENSGGVLSLLVKDIDGYDREHLKAQLLAVIRAVGGTCPKADAPMLLARALGFARTGAGITAVVESLLRGLVRVQQVKSIAGQLKVVRAGAGV